MLPPHSATLTVSPMDMLSRALFAVLTLAYVALFIPSMQAQLLMAAPTMKVMPLVFSTKSDKANATRTTTIAMVLYSVFMNAFAPERIIAAISTISAVPSGILRIRV